MTKIWVTKVENDFNDIAIYIPEDLYKQLPWHPGEFLQWELSSDKNKITITKTKIISNSK